MQLARKPMAPRPRPKPGGPGGPKCARVLPANRLSRRDFDRLVQRLVIASRRRGEPLSRAQATARAVGTIRYRPARRRAA